MAHNHTEKGTLKKLEPRIVSGSSLYEIKYHNGGEVPKCLLGKYTSTMEANKAIDNYLLQRKKKSQEIAK